MDQSRFKRRETQRPRNRQITAQTSTTLPLVTEVVPVRVKIPVQQAVPTAAAVAPQASSKPASVAEQPQAATKLVRLPALDMSLPGAESLLHEASTLVHGSKMRAVRRWSLRAVALLLILAIGGGGLVFAQSYNKLHKVFKGGSKTVAALQANVDPNLLKGEGDGRINVLVLGRGGGDHDGPDLTDTMLLESIDPVNHTTAMVSIPRDLWVQVPNAYGTKTSMKINAAWETGEFNYLGKVAPGSTDPKAIQAGFDQVDQTVESVLGVTINYNAIVDFAAFQQAVDTVGGVTVNVPTDLVDPTMAWQNHNNPVLAKAGVDAFSGAQALNYVRSRETTSDFARAMRQRSVIEALKTKVDTLGTLSSPTKISGLINAFGNNVSTDLSLTNATRLYGIIKGISDSNTTSVGLADSPNNYVTTGSADGQSIDLPTAGLNNYSAIQAYIRTQLKDGHILKEKAKVVVLNGTIQQGVATTTATTLKSYGYNVVGAATTPTTGYTQTTLVDLEHGKDKYTLNYLQQRYNVKAVSSLPDPAIKNIPGANGADFVIIVGSDEADQATNSTSPTN